MNTLYLPAALLLCTVLIALDLRRRINLTHFLPSTLLLPAALNPIALARFLKGAALPSGLQNALIAASGLLILYFWLRLSLFPVMDGQPAGPRLKIMIGGRLIIYRALWGMTLELLLLLIGYRFFAAAGVPDAVLARNAVCGVVLVLLLLANGILRIFFTSRRLSIVLRVVMLLTMWGSPWSTWWCCGMPAALSTRSTTSPATNGMST